MVTIAPTYRAREQPGPARAITPSVRLSPPPSRVKMAAAGVKEETAAEEETGNVRMRGESDRRAAQNVTEQ
ncbi:hypothetical protein FKM82_020623 [Ascaphus truei]